MTSHHDKEYLASLGRFPQIALFTQTGLLVIVAALLLISTSASAMSGDPGEGHEQKTYTHVPFSLSFVPGISTSGFMGGDIITNFSINIIGGRYAKLYGIEYGAVFNWEIEEVGGVQFAGVANILERGDLTGMQWSGVLNYVGGNVYGSQIGVVNYAKGNVNGLQMGVVKYAGGDLNGLQMGVVNYVGGNINAGVQSGVVNCINPIAGKVNRVAQIGVVNVGGDIYGAQIGVVNIGRKVTGAQVGVVNYADELNGIPVGIVSFVRKGQFHVDVWASETLTTNIGLKMGSKNFYSILALGAQPSSDPYRWATGVGMGAHIPLESSAFFNVEALSFHVNEDRAWADDLHMINKLRFVGGWQLHPSIAVFAGLTLNVSVSQVRDAPDFGWISFYDERGDDTQVQIWPGFVVGVQF